MIAAVVFTLTEHQLGDLKVVVGLTLALAVCLALYERWPRSSVD